MTSARTSRVALASILLLALALRVAAVLLIEVDPRGRRAFDMTWYDGVARRLLAALAGTRHFVRRSAAPGSYPSSSRGWR